MNVKTKPGNPSSTRGKLLDAAIVLMRRQGYSATTVDRICEAAGVTKGAFFHYFKSKEEIAAAAVENWCRGRAEGYRSDLGDPDDDPLLQLDRLLDGLMESVRNPPDDLPVCLLGMVSQELGSTNERMRETCSSALAGWTGFVAQLLRDAKKVHSVRVDFNPEEMGWMLNSLWQGSLLVAKTRRDPGLAVSNFRHARNFIKSHFDDPAASARN